jgi:hypothetical protein
LAVFRTKGSHLQQGRRRKKETKPTNKRVSPENKKIRLGGGSRVRATAAADSTVGGRAAKPKYPGYTGRKGWLVCCCLLLVGAAAERAEIKGSRHAPHRSALTCDRARHYCSKIRQKHPLIYIQKWVMDREEAAFASQISLHAAPTVALILI